MTSPYALKWSVANACPSFFRDARGVPLPAWESDAAVLAQQEFQAAAESTNSSKSNAVTGFFENKLMFSLLGAFDSDPFSGGLEKRYLSSIRLQRSTESLQCEESVEKEVQLRGRQGAIGAVIGKQGANIKTFQEKLECKIDVGRDTGQVTVSLQDEETQDAEVRRAVGGGRS